MAENDIQHETDMNQAKARLEEVAQQKEASREPAAQESRSLLRTEKRARMDLDDMKRKEIRPVNSKPKKKGFGQKLKEAMFGDEVGDGTISEHVFFRIFIPSLKRVISDMANSAINMALGLDPKTRTIGSGTTHVANASTYRDRNYNRSSNLTPGYTRRDAISEYAWDEETAKDIFNQMTELLDRYGSVSIADAYSIMDMGEKIRSTDNQWGWTSLRNAEVVCIDRQADRWIVDMPAARPL